MLSSSLHSHAATSVPSLTSRTVWHFIIAKLRNGKFGFMLFCVFCFAFFSKKRRQHGAPCQKTTEEDKCNLIDSVKSRPKCPLGLRHRGSLLFSTRDTPAVIVAAAYTENTTWRSGQRKSLKKQSQVSQNINLEFEFVFFFSSTLKRYNPSQTRQTAYRLFKAAWTKSIDLGFKWFLFCTSSVGFGKPSPLFL